MRLSTSLTGMTSCVRTRNCSLNLATSTTIALFVGWWDYMTLQKRLPVAAQVFQVWWYALNEERLSLDAPSKNGGCDG